MLIILEGLDRTGKSSVAEFYAKKGFEVIHMSAPDKKYKELGADGPMEYFIDLMTMYLSFKGKDIVLDRSPYGELIWPKVYGRPAMLTGQMLTTLSQVEEVLNAERILMFDYDTEAHWKRCVDNNEPLTREQFDKANMYYQRLEVMYGFRPRTLRNYYPE